MAKVIACTLAGRTLEAKVKAAWKDGVLVKWIEFKIEATEADVQTYTTLSDVMRQLTRLAGQKLEINLTSQQEQLPLAAPIEE